MTAPIHLFSEVQSTNDLALAGAQAGAEHGEAWLADHQLAGRGRREVGGGRRVWHSPPGQNIYLSVVVRPALKPAEVPNITLAVGARLAELLRDETGVEVWLKWPNDLLVGDAKVAGILTEGIVGSKGFEAAVVGVGVNVHTLADEIPAELDGVMTSLAIETGEHFDRMSLALKIREAIVEATSSLEAGGLDTMTELIERFDRSHGRTVEIDVKGKVTRGISRGIDRSGALAVERDGQTSLIRTGEARLVKE